MNTELTLDEINAAAELTAPAADKLDVIRELAQRQVKQERYVQYVTDHLAKAVEALNKTKRVDLPAALAAAGMKDFTLDDGTRVDVNEIISAQISEARAADAHAWLRAHNYGDIIKNQVITDFKTGDDADAARLMEVLQKDFPKIPFARKEAVHTSTLKAFVKRRLAEQAEPREVDEPAPPEFPEALFGVFRVKESVVSLPAAPKASGKR